ncbi:MAG: SAP domain-containing protein [Pseudomonadota bacterium]
MNMKEIRVVAKQRGVKPGKLNKMNLVRQIQTREGNNDCYATSYSLNCGQQSCLWRIDCSKADR